MEKKKEYGKKIVVLLAFTTLAGFSQTVLGASFQSYVQNAANLGNAYAGVASQAEDASTGFYNPAGLTHISREQVAFSTVWINSSTKLSATTARATTGAAPVLYNSTKSNNYSLVPAFHYARRINEDLVFSFNAASPCGARNVYRNDSIARYMATRSEIRTNSIGPSFGYNVNDSFSIGAGVNAIYFNGKLDVRSGSGNSSADGYQENTATAWGLGYHVGLLYEFSDQTRVGAQYRSKTREKAKGDSLATGAISRQEVKVDLTLPETASLSLYHALNDQWAVMGDVSWTRWNRLERLVLRFNAGNTLTIPYYYRNSYKVALGVNYQFNEEWRLKLGGAFDKTPIRDEYRDLRLPDTDRYWAALGAQYRVTKNLALDVGYARVFFKNAPLNAFAPIAGGGGTQGTQRFVGSSRSEGNVVGIQLTWDLI